MLWSLFICAVLSEVELKIKKVRVSSIQYGIAENIIDGTTSTGITTGWCYGSQNPKLIDWVNREDINLLKDICKHGLCTSSFIDFHGQNFTFSSDSSVYTGASVGSNSLSLESWFEVVFPNISSVSHFGARILASKKVKFEFFGSDRQIIKSIEREPGDVYWGNEFEVGINNVERVRISTEVHPGHRGYCYINYPDCPAFTIIELGARNQECNQWAEFELEKFSYINRSTMFFGNDPLGYWFETSLNGITFTSNGYFPRKNVYQVHETIIGTPVLAKFIRLNYHMNNSGSFQKMSMTDFHVYGSELNTFSCNNHGTYNNGECICNQRFFGSDCSNQTIICKPGWKGNDCKTPICPFNCWGRGQCISPGTCLCSGNHTGADCRLDKFLDTIVQDRDVIQPNRVIESFAIDNGCSKENPRKCPGSNICKTSLGKCVTTKPSTSLLGSVIKPYNATIITSSNHAASGSIIDGDESTFWQSGFCASLSSADFIHHSDINPLKGLCEKRPELCKSSQFGQNLTSLTDGDTSSPTSFPLNGSTAWIEIELPSPITNVQAIALRIQVVGKVLSVLANTNNGKFHLFNYSSGNYQMSHHYINNHSLIISSIRVESQESFSLTEIGIRQGNCSEWAMLDFGENKPIGLIRSRHYAGSSEATKTIYELSTDNIQWLRVSERLPNTVGMIDIPIIPSIQARYLRVTHFLTNEPVKVFFWEISAFPDTGSSSPLPIAKRQTSTIGEIIGINGVWGFPALRFKGISGHMRAYHNVNWDMGNSLKYPPWYWNMSAKMGTRGQWWLNWDQTYGFTRYFGDMKIQVSLQFLKNNYPFEEWTEYNSYAYGWMFARHFGPLHGTGDIDTVEIGNEPWDFNGTEYKHILKHVSRGMKDADPSMKVLHAAMPGIERLNEVLDYEIIKNLDGLNVHSYSYQGGDLGRIGVPPESHASSFRALSSFVHYRDINFPELPVYLSEFGWDAAGNGNRCRMTMCVSPEQQSVYLIRGVLLAARMSFVRASVFFYADSSSFSPEIFSRSGLLESEKNYHERKLSWYSMKIFYETMRDAIFDSVLHEDNDYYMYKFSMGNQTLVVSWRPSDNMSLSYNIEIEIPNYGSNVNEFVLGSHSLINGDTFRVQGNKYFIKISSYPTLIVYEAKQCNQSCNSGICFNEQCICHQGYTGEFCTDITPTNLCYDNGYGESNGNCVCNNTEYDPLTNCQYKKCHVNCSRNGGQCVKGKCQCPANLTGNDCSEKRCPNDCRKRGKCINGTCFCDSNITMVQPGCEWAFEKNNMPSDLGSKKCSSEKPFLCSNGTCAKSRGGCISSTSFTKSGSKNEPYYIPINNVYTSSSYESRSYIVDGNDQNAMWSSTCYKSNYLKRIDMNYALNLCSQNPNKCIYSSIENGSNISFVSDGEMIGSVHFIKSGTENAFISYEIDMFDIHLVSLFVSKTPNSDLVIEGKINGNWIQLATYQKSGGSGHKHIQIDSSKGYQLFNAIRVVSSSDFYLGEFAIQVGNCTEWAAVDLNETKIVGAVSIRVWTKDSKASTCNFEYSNDNITWTKFYSVDPKLLYKHEVPLIPQIKARFIRAIHVFPDIASSGNFWDISVYGDGGFGGSELPNIPNTRSFSQILGVNGIWQWGTNGRSEIVNLSNAQVFSKFASNGRNYHNLNWDSASPMNTPDYDEMPGSLAQKWLDWDDEYAQWNNNSVEVQVAFQFLKSQQSYDDWGENDTHVYQSAKSFGKAFSRHFGPTYGTGNVFTFEIGNEPWDYDWPNQYYHIFKGLSEGLKEGDPKMIVLPAAPPGLDNLHAVINSQTVQNIDGINAHAYSFRWGGIDRYGSMPESRASSFSTLKNIIRWRNINFPNLPVFLSEWGWGASNRTESPCKGTYCVSEAQQAAFTVRGTLIASRWNIYRASLFFYGDGSECGSSNENLFSCFGILGSPQSGYYKKQIYSTLIDFMSLLGNYKFDNALSETDEFYLYRLKNNEGDFVYVSWLPVEDLSQSRQIQLELGVVSHVLIFGKTQREFDNQFSNSGQRITLTLSGYPRLIVPSGSPLSSILGGYHSPTTQNSSQTGIIIGSSAVAVTGIGFGVLYYFNKVKGQSIFNVNLFQKDVDNDIQV